jgi:hypothetical protein
METKKKNINNVNDTNTNFDVLDFGKKKRDNSNAGGANTTLHGLSFEKKTSAENKLKDDGFIDCGYYLKKTINGKKIMFFTQYGLKKYLKKTHEIEIERHPDEAYLIEEKNKKTLIIIEKKAQICEGSTDIKLWAGPGLKREYELCVEDKIKIEYAFCVNDFFSEKFESESKFKKLEIILKENNIPIFHGDKENYLDELFSWLGIT